MVEKTIKALVGDQDSIRRRFAQILKKRHASWVQIARDIDIAPVTIRKFIMDEKDLMLKQLLKVERWVTRREKEESRIDL